MASFYKAACEFITGNDLVESATKDFCCLCFEPITEDLVVTRVNDEVVLCSYYGLFTEKMSAILLRVVGDNYADNVSVFKSVCGTCSKSAIESYQFTQKCREAQEQFVNAVDNLTGCFDNMDDNLHDYQSLYVSIDPTNQRFEQFYDAKNQEHKANALARFQNLASERQLESRKIKSQRRGKRRERDFSTIFIKTHELMLEPHSKEYKCKMCMKVYPSSGSLRMHFFSVHFKKEYQCAMCPKSFGTSGLLLTHEKVSHSTVMCEECGKELLNRPSSIKRHQMTHFKQQDKTCPRCGRVYKKITDFHRHLDQTTCDMPSKVPGNYICDSCGKHCHFKHQLVAHLRHEHGNATGHVCAWCGRKCYNQSALKIHILKHTKEKNYLCRVCGGKFVTPQSLLYHTRLHTGEKPYPCTECDQFFISPSRRKDHMDRHHTDVTYECEFCAAKYSVRRSLVNHRKKHEVRVPV